MRRRGALPGTAEVRAAPRTAGAARLVEERHAVGRELVPVHAVVDLLRRRSGGQIGRPQLDAEIALLRVLRDVQDAVARDREALHLRGDLARARAEKSRGERPGARAQVVAREE